MTSSIQRLQNQPKKLERFIRVVSFAAEISKVRSSNDPSTRRNHSGGNTVSSSSRTNQQSKPIRLSRSKLRKKIKAKVIRLQRLLPSGVAGSTEEFEFKLKIKQSNGASRKKESSVRLCASTKHSGATDVGLPCGWPTMRLPGPRQGWKGPQKAHSGYLIS